jgi:hypothetical protein
LIRLDKPIGALLLLWPTLWAVWLAAGGAPSPKVVVIFVLGTFLMRSAGCAVNDYADRNFDPYVERTRSRPLAAREIAPWEALAVGAALAAAAIVAAGAAVALPGGEDDPAPRNAGGANAAAVAAPSGSQPAALGDDWMRAIRIVSYDREGLGKPAFVDALRRAKADGATHVVLVPEHVPPPAGFASGGDVSSVSILREKTPLGTCPRT